MNRDVQLKRYKKNMEYSYTFGAFPTIELLRNQPDKVLKILVHSDLISDTQIDIIDKLCQKHGIPIEQQDKAINSIRDKENVLVIGVFRKYVSKLDMNSNHIILVNPSDMGNMGTIIRTSVGFSITNIAVIEPGVDVFNPKAVRASMGSIFSLNLQYYSSFDEYYRSANNRNMYPFMLKGATDLKTLKRDKKETFSLIFGNEATGLSDDYLKVGKSVYIKHTDKIDSLNLSLAVGIGIYEFTNV